MARHWSYAHHHKVHPESRPRPSRIITSLVALAAFLLVSGITGAHGRAVGRDVTLQSLGFDPNSDSASDDSHSMWARGLRQTGREQPPLPCHSTTAAASRHWLHLAVAAGLVQLPPGVSQHADSDSQQQQQQQQAEDLRSVMPEASDLIIQQRRLQEQQTQQATDMHVGDMHVGDMPSAEPRVTASGDERPHPPDLGFGGGPGGLGGPQGLPPLSPLPDLGPVNVRAPFVTYTKGENGSSELHVGTWFWPVVNVKTDASPPPLTGSGSNSTTPTGPPNNPVHVSVGPLGSVYRQNTQADGSTNLQVLSGLVSTATAERPKKRLKE